MIAALSVFAAVVVVVCYTLHTPKHTHTHSDGNKREIILQATAGA
jgi:hypothetical protein